MLTSTVYGRDYYEEHRLMGLDYLGHGQWQVEYADWLADVFGWRVKRLLDVGCACGSIARGFVDVGVPTTGIDINEHMIQLGRGKWPELDLHVCDAVNLHLFTDHQFSALHTAQVAEHWQPRLIDMILHELGRVCQTGTLWWCMLDTVESLSRQGRDPHAVGEDPTHVAIYDKIWWALKFIQHGWTDVSPLFAKELREHPLSYFNRYDWDWFVLEKSP